ncbi:MAG TPA: hypothetical protein VER11_16020 [Polyangiaceae bacterium]|nr:hypothetical protein [Polyangiaceae bacterium]
MGWLLAACSDGSSNCDCYGGEVCFEDVTCVPKCSESSECQTGLSCLPYKQSTICQCDPTTCAEREDCVSPLSPCRAVSCSARVACEEPDQICDIFAHRCLPINGDCSEVEVCPTLSAEASSVAVVACDPSTKLCRAQANGIQSRLVSSRSKIAVTRPKAGALIGPDELLRFEWDPPGRTTIVQVTTTVPATAAELRRFAVWGAALPRGAVAGISWGDGRPIENGQWLEQTPAPPADGVYFAWVQQVEGESLLASSDFVPFAVGTEAVWKRAGNHCDEPGFPGDCASPARPQACAAGTCRVICASDLDCAPRGCLPPEDGVRFCGL